jgi:hypothetical protein
MFSVAAICSIDLWIRQFVRPANMFMRYRNGVLRIEVSSDVQTFYVACDTVTCCHDSASS